jgi:hypothetical protein
LFLKTQTRKNQMKPLNDIIKQMKIGLVVDFRKSLQIQGITFSPKEWLHACVIADDRLAIDVVKGCDIALQHKPERKRDERRKDRDLQTVRVHVDTEN